MIPLSVIELPNSSAHVLFFLFRPRPNSPSWLAAKNAATPAIRRTKSAVSLKSGKSPPNPMQFFCAGLGRPYELLLLPCFSMLMEAFVERCVLLVQENAEAFYRLFFKTMIQVTLEYETSILY